MKNSFSYVDTLHLAREQRKNPTEAEKVLWERLRNRKLGGFKFRRQHVVRDWIADFYCSDARLIVEVDGGVHWEEPQSQKDQNRDYELSARGYRVVRVGNEEVISNTDVVCARILDVVYEEVWKQMR